MIIGSRDFEIGKRTYVMGILNVTPDSFSDGGKYLNVEDAVRRVGEMIVEGADIIDIGGESTRPGHMPISTHEELFRVIPAIKEIRKNYDIPISIDTNKSRIAEEAIQAGADMINDIWGLKRDAEMAAVAARYNVPLVIMHNKEEVYYYDLIEDMLMDFRESINIADNAGVSRSKLIIDPGIGFGKTLEMNLYVLKSLERFRALELPMLVGVSRKSVIGEILDVPYLHRVHGTVAVNVMCIEKGASFIRVHDVKQNKQAAMMCDAIMRARRGR